MKLIQVKPTCFLNMETISMIHKEVVDQGNEFVEVTVLTTVTGNIIELEQNFDDFMKSIRE